MKLLKLLFVMMPLMSSVYGFAGEVRCAALLREFDEGEWLSGVMATSTFSLNVQNTALEVKSVWNGHFDDRSYEVETKTLTEEERDQVMRDCGGMFSRGDICSRTASLTLVAGNHEDDAFILSFSDKEGTVVGRIAGVPGVIGECLDLQ